ncbi:MAG: HRDC domain-containing protein [Micropruina sp.]|uniref:HRDC domain-containing protein n=1 Tax=Micropruina sp. TaxID=2737536 RepID=UPI0039E2F7AE
MSEQPEDDAVLANETVPLDAPADGVPEVVRTPEGLAAATAALAAGSGPVAIDTERAQGFRYSARAYLIQLRREGAGTVLLDPIPFMSGDDPADFSELADALADAEWVLHAATQDLPCLAEVKLLPRRLFDTELAARLLGMPRVALGTLIEEAFGLTLRKEHSAADWSRRPLPDEWLNYAALDVEKLVELRDWLEVRLQAAGKEEWAAQEFAHLVDRATVAAPVRTDPWRRTSGLHAVRTPRALAVVRELWQVRDQLASGMDRAPGKVLPDRAITTLAARANSAEVKRLGPSDLAAVPEFAWRFPSRYRARWLAALDRVAALTRAQLPARQLSPDGPPPPRTWESRNPEAAARWDAVRPAVVERAEQLELPVENLISPDALRRLLWQPPDPLTAEAVDAALAAELVRPWQREQLVSLIVQRLAG